MQRVVLNVPATAPAAGLLSHSRFEPGQYAAAEGEHPGDFLVGGGGGPGRVIQCHVAEAAGAAAAHVLVGGAGQRQAAAGGAGVGGRVQHIAEGRDNLAVVGQGAFGEGQRAGYAGIAPGLQG